MAGTTAFMTVGCDALVSEFSKRWNEDIPASLSVPRSLRIDPDFHLLSRATFGLWPGDLAHLKQQGQEAWIEEQLHPERMNDTACDVRAERFESLSFEPADALEFRRNVIRNELVRHRFLRAVYSRRQLYETMVEFWTNHLNIDLGKGDCVYFKPSDDRDVIRTHALGRLHDLIRTSATSPAMLTYLDGASNKVRPNRDDHPNENYARELLELHTLGVDGGYTQDDVREAARCLSGWTFNAKRIFALNQNKPFFRNEWHDQGEKVVLGQRIAAGGGPTDIDRLIDIACDHPSTALHVARKLCMHFVSSSPSHALVQDTASVLTAHRGQIRPVIKHILRSRTFADAPGILLKRPFRFVVSSLRALAADTHALPPLLTYLHRMGQPLFEYPTPDGYPLEEAAWVGTLLWRWNFAFALAANKLPTVRSPLADITRALKNDPHFSSNHIFAQWFAHLTGRMPSDEETLLFQTSNIQLNDSSQSEWLSLILASPTFQRY